ncbi:MAG TPA: endolytic transglycosylase MltG, partial [Solirubrobacterales bacterium]|nr:endolytic transglycosylase MltG [Solirubrobacterales bacterium]
MSEDWFDEDPAAAERERRRREREERRGAASIASPPAQRPPERVRVPRGNRRRIVLAGAVAAILLIGALAAAAAYRHSNHDAPPPVVLKTITVTIPEGYSREQTAQIAEEAGLAGSYLKASKGHEGFLFPDTFELEKGAPASDLVELQLQDFKRRIAGVDMGYARSKNLTTSDVVTIASMIEREAQLESERPLIGAVIYNRLHEGMPLGIDAT